MLINKRRIPRQDIIRYAEIKTSLRLTGGSHLAAATNHLAKFLYRPRSLEDIGADRLELLGKGYHRKTEMSEEDGKRKRRLLRNPFAPPKHIHPHLQYNVKTIYHLSELKPGDHIKVNRDKYDHHLLVVKAVSDEKVHVIHYGGGDEGPRIRFKWPPTRPDMGMIVEEECGINPGKVTVLTFKDPPATLYSPEEAFERARTRLGERRWELFTNNCEHLVNWAFTGVACSSQQDASKEVGKDFLETAVKIGVVAGPVLGAAAGLAKALSSHTQYRRDVKEEENALRDESNSGDGQNGDGEKGDGKVKEGEEDKDTDVRKEEQNKEEKENEAGESAETEGQVSSGNVGAVSAGDVNE